MKLTHELNVTQDCRNLVDLWQEWRFHRREANRCWSEIKGICGAHGVNLRKGITPLRRGVLIAALLVGMTALAGAPGVLRTSVPFEFYYPTGELFQVDLFKVYSSTSATNPVATWPLYGTLSPTNLTILATNSGYFTNRFTLPIDAQQRYFVMTASNWWGEGPFSVVTNTPPIPRYDTGFRIGP